MLYDFGFRNRKMGVFGLSIPVYQNAIVNWVEGPYRGLPLLVCMV